MIDAKIMREAGILIVYPEAKLQSADFEQLNLLVNPYIEEHGSLQGILIDAESFPGWQDFSSMLSHLRFVRNHHEKVKRVAAVTDNSFIAILPAVAGHFVAAEVRHFSYQERDKALNWLKTGST